MFGMIEIINKEFADYKTAKLLEGFNIPSIATIDETEYLHINGTKRFPRGSMMYDTVVCPLYSSVFTFFREKYNLDSWIYTQNKESYWIAILSSSRFVKGSQEFKSFNEAQIKCVDILIKIVQMAQKIKENETK